MASTSAMAASSARPISHHWRARQLAQRLLVEDGALARVLGTLGGLLAHERRLQARIDVAVEDLQLVVAVLGEALDLLALDRHGALVLLDAVAVEDAHLDHGAVDARRQPSDVSRTSEAFSPKMARSSFSSGVIGLSPLGVILPTRMSPGLHLRADEDDAGLVEVPQRLFRDVGDVARDLLGPSLVSRAITSNSSMWIEVKMSSHTTRSESRIESSKL